MIRAIATNSIDAWLEGLAAEAVVFVPAPRPDGTVALEPMGHSPRAVGYRRLAESPRRILLPQVDELVRFEGHDATAVLDQTQRILFGLRPATPRRWPSWMSSMAGTAPTQTTWRGGGGCG